MRLVPALVLCLALTLRAAFAQGVFAPIALVGTWTTSSKHPNGATVVATVAIQQSMKFTGSVAVDGKPLWDYSGTWSASGNVLTWRYDKSTSMQVPPGTVDTDEIVAVDGAKLVLVSKLSGKRVEYERVR